MIFSLILFAVFPLTVLSSENETSKGSPQYEWLKSELERVDRCATPWLFVSLHRLGFE